MTELVEGPPVYDIECLDWIEPIAVGLYDGKTYTEFLKTSDEDDVIWKFLTYLKENCKGIKLYAHNAAKYDAKFILAKLQERKQVVRIEAGLMRLVWPIAKITFEDSYAVAPSSLKDLCEGFGVERKLDWEHEDTDKPWKMPTSQLDAFRAYLRRDCLSLSAVMSAFCKKLLVKFGIVPGFTLSLTAMRAFDKNFYPVKDIESNERCEPYIRASIYGGRNEVYKMYGEDLNFYDARSMYMSCYDVPVPIGKMLWTKPNIDEGTLVEATVKIPEDMYIGPLPTKHNGGLVFPVGIIKRRWWDVTEVRFALELGCDAIIHRQLRADEEPILKEFGDYVYQIRMEAKEAEAKIWKLFGLRISGKFGQSRWQSRVLHTDDIKDFTGGCPIDENEEYHEFTTYVSAKKSPYIKPAINARIRAEARVRHLKLLLEAWAKGDIFYCDTDSIICNSEMPTGLGLGDLKLVNKAQRGYFIQCKFYGYVTSWEVLHQVSAGFRDFKLNEGDFVKLLNGEKKIEDSYLGFTNWKGILESSEVRKIPRRRSISAKLGFRNRIREGQDTKPIILGPKD